MSVCPSIRPSICLSVCPSVCLWCSDNFRTRHYSVRNRSDMFNVWGFEDTHQFWTLFPHTPDNSFLGFVVEAPPHHMTGGGITRKDQGVLYGKDRMYLSGKEKFVSAIADLVEVHATFKVRRLGKGIIYKHFFDCCILYYCSR